MKKTNKGFSLVELIIVIAIMAILAAALAPALIRYIDKSRRSSDLSNAGVLQSAAQTAAADESAYAEIAGAASTADAIVLEATEDTAWTVPASVTSGTKFKDEFTATAGTKAPKIKLKKGTSGATKWEITLTKEGGFKVSISGTELVPSAQGPWAN